MIAKGLRRTGEENVTEPVRAPSSTNLFGLNEIDEIAAGVLEDHDLDGSHVLGLAAELDSTRLEALDLGGDVL